MPVVPDDGAHSELERLQEEERALSLRRRRLHERIDFLRGSGTEADDPGLAGLLDDERDVSARRRALHERIDALRASLGLPVGPPPKTLDLS